MKNLFKTTHWYNKYLQFIASRPQMSVGYVEKHHIIPRSLGGDNQSNNIVRLTAREHYISHVILAKGTKHPSMICALHKMMFSDAHGGRDYRITSRVYEFCKTEHAKIVSRYSTNTVTCINVNTGVTARVPSDEFYRGKDVLYVAVSKGNVRNKNSTEQSIINLTPYEVVINNKVLAPLEVSKRLSPRLLKTLATNQFSLKSLSIKLHQIYTALLGIDTTQMSQEYLEAHIIANVKVVPKPDKTQQDIINYFSKTRNIGKESAKKSRETRCTGIYITPLGDCASGNDVKQLYSWATDNTLKSIRNNNKLMSTSMARQCPKSLIGKTWADAGFSFSQKSVSTRLIGLFFDLHLESKQMLVHQV